MGVQFGVNLDYDYHPNIPYNSDTINGQKNQEEGDLQLWII